MSTHDLSIAQAASSSACVLNRRQVAFGPIAEALSAEHLRQAYGANALVMVADSHHHHGLSEPVMARLFIDPFQAGYLQRALIEAVMLGVVGGIIGVHVVLRRLEFMADALTHTVFPGLAAAFVLGGSLYVGALVTGVASAVLLTLLTRNRRVTSDAALAVLLTGFFSIGVIIVSRSRSYTADLTTLLFGRVLAVDVAEIVATAVTGAVVLAVAWALHKELVLRAFDPEAAEALGYSVTALDLVLNVAHHPRGRLGRPRRGQRAGHRPAHHPGRRRPAARAAQASA